MAWQLNPGLPGKVFCPEVQQDKKHACPDCFACQQCSEDRCTLCRADRMSTDPGKSRSDLLCRQSASEEV